MFTAQKGNNAGGDVVGGNKVTYYSLPPSPLARLYQRLREATQGEPQAALISEQLQHYCSAATDGDVRGLEDKLSSSGRTDLLPNASFLKESATKLVMKWQTSGVAQDILTMVLGHLYAEFFLHATPAIQEGRSRTEIDAIISEKVIAPTAEMLGDNDLMLTKADLLGLLFFLGGNCHVRWDAC